jgi:hypothetical protein
MMCDQDEETTQHILLSCVFARDIWCKVLSIVGLQLLTPGMGESVIQEWPSAAVSHVLKVQKKSLNFLIILVSWWLWKHKNLCVFEKASPSSTVILQHIREDVILWGMVGAKALRRLWP